VGERGGLGWCREMRVRREGREYHFGGSRGVGEVVKEVIGSGLEVLDAASSSRSVVEAHGKRFCRKMADSQGGEPSAYHRPTAFNLRCAKEMRRETQRSRAP